MVGVGHVVVGPHGRYRITAQHGQGGFGITYLAVREEDEAPVVVKLLKIAGLPGWKAFELFERETSVLRALSHPGIPAWIDDFPIGEADAPSGFALVMELIPGPTLRDIARAAGLAAEANLAWFSDILAVLAYLHERSPPVIHRDVTPKNVIVRPEGPAALVDFGAVQAAWRAANTISSTAAGTFGYAPFEQFLGRATPSCDLYGLGMTFLAVKSGREPEQMPFDGVRVKVADMLAGPPRLSALIESMTEPDPRARLGSAREALGALAAIEARAPIAVTPRLLGVDGYLEGLAARLRKGGFDLDRRRQIGFTRLSLLARGTANRLRPVAMHIYATRGDQMEGGASGRPIGPVPCGLFVQAAADDHRADRGFVEALVGGRTVVVAIVVAPSGVAPRTAAHLASSVREPDGVSVVPVLVDLDAESVEVVTPRSLLPADPAGVVALVRPLVALPHP